MEIADRAVAANQQTKPNHWTYAQQHDLQLIDVGGRNLGHAVIIALCTYEAILAFNLPRFFFTLL